MQKRAQSNFRRRIGGLPSVEPLEERWLLEGSSGTAWLMPATFTPATASPEASLQVADPPQLVTLHPPGRGVALTPMDFVVGQSPTGGVILPGKGVADLGHGHREHFLLPPAGSPDWPAGPDAARGGARWDPDTAAAEETVPCFQKSSGFPSSPGAGRWSNDAPSTFLLSDDGVVTDDGSATPPLLPSLFKRSLPPRQSDASAKGENGPVPVRRSLVEARVETALPAEEDPGLRPPPAPHGGREGSRAALPPSPDLSSLALASAVRAGTISAERSPRFENVGPERWSVVASAGSTLVAAWASIFPSRSSDSAGTTLRASRGSLASLEQPRLPGDGAAIPDSQAERVPQTEPAAAPLGANLLTEGVTFGVTALERAVQALVEPMRDVQSKPNDLLYLLSVSSWLLAAVLACEGVRRHFLQRTTQGLALPVGASDLLVENDS